jgi:benzoyl-CoA reductase/2-hydroxyglutaryl-CoA dehydratase subunit BcrC/BadD/HgdB
MDRPQQITVAQWDTRWTQLSPFDPALPGYCSPLSHHVKDGDQRLLSLIFDNAPACLRLWSFLLTEEARLHQARAQGKKIVGTMKDLGTVPVMAYALDNLVAFYPDGAWWIPCVMELGAGLLSIADRMGIDDSFCPVRAMLGAFVTEAHFPRPDLLTCSVGAVCDDFSAIAQHLNGLGFPIHWWEIPHRRQPDPDEEARTLPGGFSAPQCQLDFVQSELQRVREALEMLSGQTLDDAGLAQGIQQANTVRQLLADLRQLVYGAPLCPIPALEMLIAEMLALHFCSDRTECRAVLKDLLGLARARVQASLGYGTIDTARIFWVNPVADLRVMNLLEQCGARICGTEYLFSHALDRIPEHLAPLEALACSALADPMIGSSQDRAERIAQDMQAFNAEGLVISRIPGASHCGLEGRMIGQIIQDRLQVPTLEIEIPPITDSLRPALQTRLEALVETIKERRAS